jgi:hypothetical protein
MMSVNLPIDKFEVILCAGWFYAFPVRGNNINRKCVPLFSCSPQEINRQVMNALTGNKAGLCGFLFY